ncbi:methyltransferase, FxLD system [Actinophytocola glycyrrhizae]|uniref:Protein-L-isoaspartate O-methyltransferase n=1 Tax=Actinophytocola glycyrrhizae TaxID=2044873 RepID=A0ABV9SCU2_9PSEU
MPAELNTLRRELFAHIREQGAAADPLVAEALRTVSRHLFLPDLPPDQAYRDEPIVTKRDADGRPVSSSSQPTIMAIMLDQLAPRRGQRVLEIGAGTGFNAALLASIVGERGAVTSVDLDADTVAHARENLDAAGCPNVVVVAGDGALGHADGAPYHRIIATVGVWDLAPAWLEQLAPDGRIVVPLDLNGVQRSVAFERDGDRLTSRSVSMCGFIRMRGPFAGPERTYLLDPVTDLTLSLPTAREVDGDALTEVLGESPAVHAVGDIGPMPSPMQLFDGFTLWLAVHEPRWCALSEQVGARQARLAAAPVRGQDAAATAGILTDDGLALIAVDDERLTVHAHGNTAVADDLLAHVRAWAAAGRPGTEGLRIDAYPAGARGVHGDVVLEKGQCRLALSW